MKITVFCCSPKQETSVTLQAVHYLQHICKDDIFNIQMVGGQALFTQSHAEAISDSDLVLFASPLMQYGLPSQLMYFMENMLIAASEIAKSKSFAFLTIGNKILDETTHKYINKFFSDYEITLLPTLSLSESSLLNQYGQNELFRWSAYIKAILFGNNHISCAMPCNVIILDVSDGNDNEVTSSIMNIHSDYVSRGATVNCLNLRNFNIMGCMSCEGCLTSKKCTLAKNDDWETFTQMVFTNNAIIQVVSSLKHGMPHASFKAWLDRFHQYGITPRHNGVIWNYLVSSNATDDDINCFSEFVSTLNCFNGDIFTGVGRIKSYSSQINNVIAAFNTGLAPAETFSSAGMKYILMRQAEEFRNVAPNDYKYYSKLGAYNQIMPNPAYNPIYNPESAMMFRQARVMPYQMTINQMMYQGMYGQQMMSGAPVYNQTYMNPMPGYGQPPYSPY